MDVAKQESGPMRALPAWNFMPEGIDHKLGKLRIICCSMFEIVAIPLMATRNMKPKRSISLIFSYIRTMENAKETQGRTPYMKFSSMQSFALCVLPQACSL